MPLGTIKNLFWTVAAAGHALHPTSGDEVGLGDVAGDLHAVDGRRYREVEAGVLAALDARRLDGHLRRAEDRVGEEQRRLARGLGALDAPRVVRVLDKLDAEVARDLRRDDRLVPMVIALG